MSYSLQKGETISLSQLATQLNVFVINTTWQQKNNKPVNNIIKLNALTLNEQNEINDIICIEQPISEEEAILFKNKSFKIDLSKIPLSTKNVIFTLNSEVLSFNLLTITSTLLDFNSQQKIAHYIIDDATDENTTLIALVLYRHQTQWHLKAVAQNNSLNAQANHDNDNKIEDSDIIEVSQTETIDYTHISPDSVVVPFWEMQYIYSYTALNNATEEQTNFYFYFKEQIEQGHYIELGNNLNYAFILLFNFIDEYQHHQYLDIVKTQLKLLGEFYPKTKPYCIKELEKLKYGYSNYQSYHYYHDGNRLGHRYKTRLALNEAQINLLNQFNHQKNSFSEIECCLIATIKLYLDVITQLDTHYSAIDTSLTQQISLIADLIARKEHRYRKGSANYDYNVPKNIQHLYSVIFRFCENSLRTYYQFGKTLNIDYHYQHEEIQLVLNEQLIPLLTAACQLQLTTLAPLNETAEIALNLANKNRWKIKFKQLSDNFTVPKAWQFIEDIKKLAALNAGNNQLKTLFLDAYKFSVLFVKEPALVLYCYYSYHYDASPNKYKTLTKKEQKLLFSTSTQQQRFDAIISNLLKTKNLETALQQSSDFYNITRKTIQLNHQEINSIQQQHHQTVSLLNTYLQDDNEEHLIETKPANKPIVKAETNVIATNELGLNELQFMLIKLFFEHDFSIEKSVIEKLIKEHGLFTGQVIDSINETCYETLDDVLIEQEDNNYTINPQYYQRIIALC